MDTNFKSPLLFLFSIFIFGCFNTNIGIILEADKSYIFNIMNEKEKNIAEA